MNPKAETNPLWQPYLDSVYMSSHSNGTVYSYTTALRHFEKFTIERHQYDIVSILSKIKEKKIDELVLLRDFAVWLDKSGKSASSIHTWFFPAKGFLTYNGIKIYNEDLRHMLRLPKRIRRSEIPMTKEMLNRLLRNCNYRLQAIILVAVASGMRIGEIVQLRTSDIDFESKPVKIRVRAEVAKGKQARESFLTSEASIALQDYLKRSFGWEKNNKQDILIFTKLRNDAKPNVKSIEASFLNSLKRAISQIPDLSIRNENGRYAVHFHAFRKYARTVVGSALGRDFAEAFVGHKFYMDTYYNLPESTKKEYYLKAEPYLTISDHTAVERKLEENKELTKDIKIIVHKILKDSFQLDPRIRDLILK